MSFTAFDLKGSFYQGEVYCIALCFDISVQVLGNHNELGQC